MASIPYHNSFGQFIKMLNSMGNMGIPPVVDAKFFGTLGLESTAAANRRLLLALGMIDDSGVPTGRWKAFRDTKTAPKILAQGIVDAYSGLFSLYPNAYELDEATLRNYFASETDHASSTVKHIIRTFQGLCELADFTDPVSGVSLGETASLPTDRSASIAAKEHITATGKGQAVTVNVNIQLVLPETKDDSVYDSFFRALREHLLS